jgi:hypothetical protein
LALEPIARLFGSSNGFKEYHEQPVNMYLISRSQSSKNN